jgi:DNA helicase HerA-like ATPase
MSESLHIGTARDGPPVSVPLSRLNRHALIAGATGTGKTTTAAAICERLADAGVPVLALDAKGDLEGLTRSRAGSVVLDPFGDRGKARPLDLELIGPDNLARALDLSDAQSGAVFVAFEAAARFGFSLSSLRDLDSVLKWCVQNAQAVAAEIGLISPASAAAVSRALLRLQRDAGDAFGVSAQGFRLDPFEAAQISGVTLLSCARLTHTPGLYGAAAAYILGRLFERAPEVGDTSRPALAVFFDESHLMFEGAPAAQIRRLEMAVRLIRSKGIACIFATQSPADLPPGIAGQLQTRIQHSLRAVTPAQRRGLEAAAESMPSAPGLDAAAELQRLPIGSALVSVPDAQGAPTPAAVVEIAPPRAQIGPLKDSELKRDPAPARSGAGSRELAEMATELATNAEAFEIERNEAARTQKFGLLRWAGLLLLIGYTWAHFAG